jgi:hypothetical protein
MLLYSLKIVRIGKRDAFFVVIGVHTMAPSMDSVFPPVCTDILLYCYIVMLTFTQQPRIVSNIDIRVQ